MMNPKASPEFWKALTSLKEHRDFYAHYQHAWMKSFFGNFTNHVLSGLLSFGLQLIGLGIIILFLFIEFNEMEIFEADPSATLEEMEDAMMTVRIVLPLFAILFFGVGRLLRSIRMRNLIIAEFQEHAVELVSVMDSQIEEIQTALQSTSEPT